MCPAACVAEPLGLKQRVFTAAQLLLGLFTVINVRKQDIPTDSATFSVAQREAAGVEPAVHTISTAQTVINVVLLPGFDRAPPRNDRLRQVLGVNGVAGGPPLQFCQRLAEIFQAWAVDEFDLTCRSHNRDVSGNAIHDQPKTFFTRAEGILGALSVLNLRTGSIP